MLITPDAWDALLGAGIVAHPTGPSDVELRAADDDSAAVIATVVRRALPLSPSHVRHAPPPAGRGEVLLMVPSATAAALAAAGAAGISVLADDGSRRRPVVGRIILPGRVVEIGVEGERPPLATASSRRGPRPWGALAVVRDLLAGGTATQTTLAARAQVTQGRVSQSLRTLVDAGLVTRAPGADGVRWTPTDWDALTDWWLDAYPGPGGLTTYWYGLDGVVDQARAAVSSLSASGVPVAVSGDVAADELAPWRRPGRAVVYAAVSGHPATASDLRSAGLTPSGPDEATLELVVPADRGVWERRERMTTDLPITDGLQVLWDVRRSPGSDTDQAATALRTVLRARAGAGHQR